MDSFKNYQEDVFSDNDCQELLKKTPWVLTGARQENFESSLLNEAARLSQIQSKLKFSIITPMYNTPPNLLTELIASCRLQSWFNWELILADDGSSKKEHLEVAAKFSKKDQRVKFFQTNENLGISGGRNYAIEKASGDWVGFLDHDDILHPQALGIFARTILESVENKQNINFVFSNECKINEEGTAVSDFFIKPDFCISTLIRSNYIAHLTFVEKCFLFSNRLNDGRFFRKEFDGVEDHDFFLRLGSAAGFSSQRITEYCYYWRKIKNSTADSLDAKPYVSERGLKLISEFLNEKGYHCDDLAPNLTRNNGGNRFFRCSFSLNKNIDKKLLVIVPFKNGPELTISCLESLEQQDLEMKVVLIDNDSTPETFDKVSAWIQKKRRSEFIIDSFKGAFNYAKINNVAFTRHSAGFDFVLFLNNDVELSSPKVVSQMISAMMIDPGIGFCGIKLFYPRSHEVQHGGIKIGFEATGKGYFRPAHMTTMSDFVHDDHVVTAVSFACAMTRCQTFEKLGMLEEVWMPNGLGDVDICLKANEAGYRNLYLGSCEGIHHESITRKKTDESLELAYLYQKHGKNISNAFRSQLGYDSFNALNSEMGWLDKPIRYKVADYINDRLKRLIRPLHRLLKHSLNR